MAIETGMGSRAERSPASSSSSSGKTSSSAASDKNTGKTAPSSGSVKTTSSPSKTSSAKAGNAGGYSAPASLSENSGKTSSNNATANNATAKNTAKNSGTPSSLSESGKTGKTSSSPAAGKTTAKNAPSSLSGNSGSRDTVAQRNAGAGMARTTSALASIAAADAVQRNQTGLAGALAGYAASRPEAQPYEALPNVADSFRLIDQANQDQGGLAAALKASIAPTPQFDTGMFRPNAMQPGVADINTSIDMLSGGRSRAPSTPGPTPAWSAMNDVFRPNALQPGAQDGDAMIDALSATRPRASAPAKLDQWSATDLFRANAMQPGAANTDQMLDALSGMRSQPAATSQGYIGPFGDAKARVLGQMAGDDQVFDPYSKLLEDAEAQTQPYPAPSRDRPVDARIVQTLLGEAGGEGPRGIAAVGQSVMNRSQEFGPDRIKDPLDIVLASNKAGIHQYSTWNSAANQGNNPINFQPGDPAFEQAEEIWRDVRDNAFDFTGGATNYFNPNQVNPSWAQPNVLGTENIAGTIDVGDHRYLPRVSAAERASINANPALSRSVAAGASPDRAAPVPRDRPAGLGGAQTRLANVEYTEAGKPISPTTGFLMSPEEKALYGIDAAPAGQPARLPDISPAASAAARPEINYAMPAYAGGLSDQYIPDRLPSEDLPGRRAAAPAPSGLETAYVLDPRTNAPVRVDAAQAAYTLADLGGGPRSRPNTPTYSDTTMGGGTGPAVGSGKTAPVPRDRPDNRDMSVWDKTVSAAGDALDNSLIGGAVKAIFPEFWDGMGKTMAGMDDGTKGGGSRTSSVYDDYEWDPFGGSNGQRNFNTPFSAQSGATDPAGTPLPPVVPTPGGGATDPITGIWYPQVRWPDASYNPGVSGEWDYFPGFAEGGMVPDARAAELPATSGLDPRLVTIMNAEDALRGQHPDPEKALADFVKAFGEGALKQLMERVQGGMAQQAPQEDSARMIEGPGGPTDDMVPALIDGHQPAKLSSGEVVIPAAAVAGAGDGDPVAGAERLMQLSDALGGKA